MEIRYDSTRGGEQGVSASHAILQGLAKDGGLFVPQQFPTLEHGWEEMKTWSYQEIAYTVMRPFLGDFTPEEVRQCIADAYDDKFDIPEICRLQQADDAWFLELFHGKTIAFKDMALSILPHLMTTAAQKNDMKEQILILTATSGDTGKAAMEGFADVPGTAIMVFYPKEGVSEVQERQMLTQKGDNVRVVGIRGNFDDAQTGVKELFRDPALQEQLRERGVVFSSANSINIGRLVPQIVYYVYAYTRLLASGAIEAGEEIQVVVPTGNFGNILAAYYAKRMGLPVRRLLCASNRNHVLTDFFTDGVYDRNRPFYVTSSPSMDILVSSNLERLLYHASGDDPERTATWMHQLQEEGRYTVPKGMRTAFADFLGAYADEESTAETIRRIHEKDGYLIDPHTAVAACVYDRYRQETGDESKTVIVSTASPYKFGDAVLHALQKNPADDTSMEEQFAAIRDASGVKMPAAVRDLLTAKIRYEFVADPDQMKEEVLRVTQEIIRPIRP